MAAGSIAFSVSAQRSNQVVHSNSATKTNLLNATRYASPYAGQPDMKNHINYDPNFKTTAVVFVHDSMGANAQPSGWTLTGGWQWRTNEPGVIGSINRYTVDMIESATGPTGYFCFRSDSIATVSTAVITGDLTSPAYDCSGRTSVGLTFSNLFRKFNDSCFVDVSNDGTTWTRFPVYPNNTFTNNDETSLIDAPVQVFINISAVASNQPTVYIRFAYMGPTGGTTGGAYQWSIDDLKLSELDPVELVVNKSCIIRPVPFNTGVGSVPTVFADTFYSITALANYGGDPQTNVTVNQGVYNGATLLNTYPTTFATLPINAYDSIAETPAITTTALGSYSSIISCNVAGDADPTNNLDTVAFNITDTVYSQESGDHVWAFWCHIPPAALINPAAAPNGVSRYLGAAYDIPKGKMDSLSSVSVGFHRATSVGSKVSVQLYVLDLSSGARVWKSLGGTFAKTLTAADITPAGAPSPTMSNFVVNPATTGGKPIIIGSATESQLVIAALQIDGVAKDSTVRVSATRAPGFALLGRSYAVWDTSNNNGDFKFGATDDLTGYDDASPAIRMNFGKIILSVKDIDQYATSINAYPNPANTNLTVSFEAKVADDARVSITNTLGQNITEQKITGKTTGQKTANFNIANLANGVYFYTVEIGGARTTQRFVVAH